MATREQTIRLPQASYDLLLQEASRRGVEPDALADELVRADLGASTGYIESALAGLAELRRRLPDIDGVVLAREARTELERRGTPIIVGLAPIQRGT
jgi:DNA-binding response OmpR family regulator